MAAHTSIFKIRGSDGTFSQGGSTPTFNKAGKLWKRRGDISSHFTQLDRRGRQIYAAKSAVVVELVTVEVETTPANEWIDAATARKDERQAEWDARRAAWQRKHDEALYERLAKELGK